MVHFGLRDRTIDIDVALEVEPKHHQPLIEAIRRLKEELNMNIEEAGPKEFIPLPSGWKERCLSIGRFGSIEVFHFDLYSTALSKIERGTEVDFDDVLSLLRSGKIEMEKLEACYREILPKMGVSSLKQDPSRFQRNFEIMRKKLGQ